MTRTMMVLLLFVLVLGWFWLVPSGYTWSEKRALEQAVPAPGGSKVYEKAFGSHKVVIWKTPVMTYAQLLETRWGILHRVITAAQLAPRLPDDALLRTWSAHLNESKQYETLFAIETLDPEMTTVLISNDPMDDEAADTLDEIRQRSSLSLELKVEDRYAVLYTELPAAEEGGFVFRGIDSQGQIKFAGR
ncbi:hypothetical protein WMW72_07805 [Paenibacillus filicis]|uniref:Uncharacterized protein n=1 Tax=Paenibacillus filicis TaxID=669464 RepID=A0ABU9DG17_9BACL